MPLVPGETEPVTRRRYRDMFKGVKNANAHFRQLFEGLGLKTTHQSYIKHIWQGQIDGRALHIAISNTGRWEVGQVHIEINIPLTVDTLLAVGSFIPPLRRVGMTVFGPIRPHLSSYTHDEGWSRNLVNSPSGSMLVDGLEDNDFLYMEPKKLTWIGDILGKDDLWIENHLRSLVDLANTAQAMPAAKAVPDSMIRRFAPVIALGLGVVFLGFVLLCFLGIGIVANL